MYSSKEQLDSLHNSVLMCLRSFADGSWTKSFEGQPSICIFYCAVFTRVFEILGTFAVKHAHDLSPSFHQRLLDCTLDCTQCVLRHQWIEIESSERPYLEKLSSCAADVTLATWCHAEAIQPLSEERWYVSAPK